MGCNTYELDTTIQLTGTFADSLTGELADPTTITLFVLNPQGVNNSYTYAASQVVRVGVGIYTYTFTPDASGEWLYKWQGEGTVIATSPDTAFVVRASALIAG